MYHSVSKYNTRLPYYYEYRNGPYIAVQSCMSSSKIAADPSFASPLSAAPAALLLIAPFLIITGPREPREYVDEFGADINKRRNLRGVVVAGGMGAPSRHRFADGGKLDPTSSSRRWLSPLA